MQPTSSAEEIAGHFDRVPPFAMFASQELLPLAQEAVQLSSLSDLPLYRLSVPPGATNLSRITTLDDLIAAAKDLPPVQKGALSVNEATRRVAYYCTTSGTSGFQVTNTTRLHMSCDTDQISFCCCLVAHRGHHARKPHRQHPAGFRVSRDHQRSRLRDSSGLPAVQPHLWSLDSSSADVSWRQRHHPSWL